jgi:hypothetical protein
MTAEYALSNQKKKKKRKGLQLVCEDGTYTLYYY